MSKDKENPTERRADELQPLVTVYRTFGLLRAEVVKGKLESAGIPAMLKYESMAPVMGMIVDGMGEVQVLVSKDYEQEALQVLKNH